MNKLMLASLTLLLAGATALPADAQDDRRRGGNDSTQDSDGGRDRGGEAERSERRQPAGDQRRGGPRNAGDRGPDDAPPAAQGRRFQPGNQAGVPRGRNPAPVSGATARPPLSDGNDHWNGGRRDNRYVGRDDRRDDRWDRRDDRRDNRRDDRHVRREGRRDDRYDRWDHRYDHRDHRRGHRYVRGNDRRWNGNRWYPQYRYRAPVRYVYPRGYRAYQWRVGHRLPASYYQRNYYLDYRAYRLPPPPYGYHWVRVDHDVVLVALASGLIRDILYGLYY